MAADSFNNFEAKKKEGTVDLRNRLDQNKSDSGSKKRKNENEDDSFSKKVKTIKLFFHIQL